jgi:hypothetical protein
VHHLATSRERSPDPSRALRFKKRAEQRSFTIDYRLDLQTLAKSGMILLHFQAGTKTWWFSLSRQSMVRRFGGMCRNGVVDVLSRPISQAT